MKNVGLLIVSTVLGFLVLAIVMTIGGHMNRRVELQSSLSAAMERTVELAVTGLSDAAGDWVLEAECVEVLAVDVQTDSSIEVSVYGVDIRKGMLAMKVEEHFFHPAGVGTSTGWERTVIYDRLAGEEEPASYEVRFYRNRADMLGEQNCYKVYAVQEGQTLLAPKAPVAEEAQFMGWRDLYDYMADFSQPVDGNRSYYADWE